MLHEDRERACSFGADAARYDRYRPGYPEEMVDDVVADHLTSVVDVGCGTGIASRMLLRRGCRVVGIEPDPRMGALARDSGVEVVLSRFEDWECGSERFDAVVSGQAWHWVDPLAGAVKAASVLRPNGRLALFWNIGHHEPGMEDALHQVYGARAPGLDGFSIVLGNPPDERFDRAIAGIDASGAFGAVTRRSYIRTAQYSTEDWIAHLQTHSDHQALPAEQRAGLLSAVGDILDRAGGGIRLTYETVLLAAATTGS
jgi:SAM-dependent methyltransferase